MFTPTGNILPECCMSFKSTYSLKLTVFKYLRSDLWHFRRPATERGQLEPRSGRGGLGAARSGWPHARTHARRPREPGEAGRGPAWPGLQGEGEESQGPWAWSGRSLGTERVDAKGGAGLKGLDLRAAPGVGSNSRGPPGAGDGGSRGPTTDETEEPPATWTAKWDPSFLFSWPLKSTAVFPRGLNSEICAKLPVVRP